MTSVLLLGGALVAVWRLGPRAVEEVAETLAEGPTRTLDGSLTPIRGGDRLIVICLDGVGHDVLQEVLEAGRMPSLRRVLGSARGEGGWENAHAVPDLLSILPSTTVAAWTSVFTGMGVAAHGVAGNEYFERESRRFRAPAPVSVTGVEEMMEAFNGDLLNELVAAETFYEEVPNLRHHVSLAHVHRGADVFTMPAGVEAGAIFQAFIEGASSGRESGYRLEGAKALDRESIEALLVAVDRYGLPDVQVVYFPGIDLYTHVADHPLESQKRFLSQVTDPALGRVFDRWASENALERTWVVITADHGHTPVLADDRHSLSPAPDEDDEPPAVLRSLGFTMRPLEVGVADGPWSAALAYQGAMAYVHLADRSTCDELRCDWSRPPRLAEDVLPVARAFHEANRRAGGPLEGTLDLVFAREPRPPSEDALPFQIFDGERLVPIGEYLRAHPRPSLLRLEARMEELAAGPYGHRAGDVLLLARSGRELPIEERFYFSGPYRSWHGSPSRSDSHVPLIVARRGMSAEAIRHRVERGLGPAEGGWHSQRRITPLLTTLLAGD